MQGRTRFSSSTTASTICAAAAPGAYHAEVPSRLTSSPPPLAVRSTIAWIRSSGTSLRSGTPPTVVAETTGTIWSPWPPSTIAVTSLIDAPVSQAMKAEKRAVSRMPAMPTTRSFGQPGDVLRDVAHRVERVRDDDQDRVGARGDDLLGDGPDDLLVRRDEVVAAHPRLARQPGRDHDDLRAGRLLVAVRAGDVRLVAEHRRGLVDVEGLALRKAFLDVDEHDVRVVATRDLLRAGRADVAGSDDSDLPSHPLASRLLEGLVPTRRRTLPPLNRQGCG